jgi:hypothetical protein
MPTSNGARPGESPGTGASSTSSCLVDSHHLTSDHGFRQQVRRVYALGPRSLGELLLEVERDPMGMRRHVRRYAELDPAFVEAVGGWDWLEPQHLVRKVPA